MDNLNKKNNVKEYNIYCDESCHLEHDHQPVMLLGCVWCPKSAVRKISIDLRKIKARHNALGELKWVKVSKSKKSFYIELTNYFFKTPELHFRCLVVKDKSKLNHEHFSQGSHDTFYYKMYFSMLNKILSPTNKYYVYLDIKDTRSKFKIEKLREVLCNNVYDFTKQMISKIQHIRSSESELLQLADFLIGTVGYENRNLKGNPAKVSVADLIKKRIKQNLCQSTSLYEEKFNLFIFTPSEVDV